MNIVLIGMSGSGKSRIGRKLAAKLNYRFIDVDDIMRRKAQLSLQDYIDQFGDEEFLKFEEKTVLDLDVENCVIAPGGSVVYSKKAINHLKRGSIVIFLNLSLKVLKSRTRRVDQRGIVYLKRKSYEELFNERLTLYRKYSDIRLRIDDNPSIEQMVQRLSQSLKPYIL